MIRAEVAHCQEERVCNERAVVKAGVPCQAIWRRADVHAHDVGHSENADAGER